MDSFDGHILALLSIFVMAGAYFFIMDWWEDPFEQDIRIRCETRCDGGEYLGYKAAADRNILCECSVEGEYQVKLSGCKGLTFIPCKEKNDEHNTA